MINYSKFITTDDHSFNLHNAIQYCKENKEDGIVFDKGRYDFYSEMASEHLIHVSNHDVYGETRIAFLIKEMENFTVDGGGSEFVFHGVMVPFALIGSKNITVKNLSVDYENTKAVGIKVTAVYTDSFDFEVLYGSRCYVDGNKLYLCDGDGKDEPYRYITVINDGTSKEMIEESIDSFERNRYFEDMGQGIFRCHGIEKGLELRAGMILCIRSGPRLACNIFVDRCEDTFIENVTMYRSYGMGVLAEDSVNVSIDKMTVKAREDCDFSLNADATHFVNCRGLVKVTNSSFSEQGDDAINIHGEFNPVVQKTDEYILIKYAHPQAKGLDIYGTGDEIAVLTQKTLIPRLTRRVVCAETVNMNYTKLYIEGGTEGIEAGDVIENLTKNADLLFENNTVRNNRARGMLIATKGDVVIRKNHFNTPGIAIFFESDGKFWFESGSTKNVLISQNVFDNCCFTKGKWGKNVIEIKPREEFDGENYYHGRIEVSDNKFINNRRSLVFADNVAEFVWKNNSIENQTECELVTFKNCGKVEKDI